MHFSPGPSSRDQGRSPSERYNAGQRAISSVPLHKRLSCTLAIQVRRLEPRGFCGQLGDGFDVIQAISDLRAHLGASAMCIRTKKKGAWGDFGTMTRA